MKEKSPFFFGVVSLPLGLLDLLLSILGDSGFLGSSFRESSPFTSGFDVFDPNQERFTLPSASTDFLTGLGSAFGLSARVNQEFPFFPEASEVSDIAVAFEEPADLELTGLPLFRVNPDFALSCLSSV